MELEVRRGVAGMRGGRPDGRSDLDQLALQFSGEQQVGQL
jgi:hypothetical protein